MCPPSVYAKPSCPASNPCDLLTLPEARWCWPRTKTHVNLLPWVRSTWVARGTRQQVMTPGTNRRRTIFGAIDLASGRFCYQVCRKAVSASFIAFLAQLLAAYPTAPVVAVICTGRATVLTTPDRADLGHAEGVAGQLPHAHHPEPRPPGPRLLPRSQPGAAAGDRRAAQLTVAARGLHADLQAGRLD
jgi:hypothetical protein